MNNRYKFKNREELYLCLRGKVFCHGQASLRPRWFVRRNNPFYKIPPYTCNVEQIEHSDENDIREAGQMTNRYRYKFLKKCGSKKNNKPLRKLKKAPSKKHYKSEYGEFTEFVYYDKTKKRI